MMIFFNDKFIKNEDAFIATNDRGFLFGDGIFDTCAARYGKIYGLEAHIQRLKNHAEILQLPQFPPDNFLRENILKMIEINQLQDSPLISIRTTFTRGTNHPRGIVPAPAEIGTPTLIIQANIAPIIDTPAHLLTTDIRRNEGSPISRIKSLNYADAVLARLLAQKNNVDDILFLNNKGHVCCTSIANIFIIRDNKIFTPPLSDGVMDGTIRQTILDLAQKNNMSCNEQSLLYEDIIKADAVFISNSLILMRPVASLDGHEYQKAAHDLYARLFQILQNEIN